LQTLISLLRDNHSLPSLIQAAFINQVHLAHPDASGRRMGGSLLSTGSWGRPKLWYDKASPDQKSWHDEKARSWSQIRYGLLSSHTPAVVDCSAACCRIHAFFPVDAQYCVGTHRLCANWFSLSPSARLCLLKVRLGGLPSQATKGQFHLYWLTPLINYPLDRWCFLSDLASLDINISICTFFFL
jgi:hypothetical protein